MRNALDEVCRQDGMSGLYAFGSRGREALDLVTGERGEGLAGPADLDIGARPRSGVWWGVEEKVRLALALEDLYVLRRAGDLALLERERIELILRAGDDAE